jgi:hypothetical protein
MARAHDPYNHEYFDSNGTTYLWPGVSLYCDVNEITGIVLGIGTFLILIIYLLWFLRFWRMKRWGTRTMDFRTAKGRTEILVTAFMTFLTVCMIMAFVSVGMSVKSCHAVQDMANAVDDKNHKMTDEAYGHYYRYRRLAKGVVEASGQYKACGQKC